MQEKNLIFVWLKSCICILKRQGLQLVFFFFFKYHLTVQTNMIFTTVRYIRTGDMTIMCPHCLFTS